MKEIGYQWYLWDGWEYNVINEYIYASLEDAQEAIASFLEGCPEIPLSACGIDKVENDEGYVTVLERTVIPTAAYWREWDD